MIGLAVNNMILVCDWLNTKRNLMNAVQFHFVLHMKKVVINSKFKEINSSIAPDCSD